MPVWRKKHLKLILGKQGQTYIIKAVLYTRNYTLRINGIV